MGFKSLSSPDLFSAFLASPPKNETLQRVDALVDWQKLRDLMARAYSPGEGREGYDPVMLFKLLLLEQWYRLSDGDAVWMAADSLSFRQFLGLGAGGKAPDDTTLVKFRNRLRGAGLLDDLYAEVICQMEDRGLGIREGSVRIVDATIIAAAVRPSAKPTEGKDAPAPLDPDADYTVKNGKPHYGYKLHLGQDRETGLVTDHVTSVASLHDSQVFSELLSGEPSLVLADKGYDSKALRTAARSAGITPAIMRRAKPGKPLSPWHQRKNQAIGRLRASIEGANATLKRWLNCGRARYRGLDRTAMQMSLGVLAFNLRRYAALAGPSCVR